jgi:DNA-binding NarL/FixJ family response regulator
VKTMKPKRVLLVDDNQDFLKAAKRFLRAVPGLELAGEATSGEQAIELSAALQPDLVLMDFAMPGMNGLAATLRIKQQPNAPKVIMVTLHTHAALRALANEAGADGFLQKEDLVLELPRLLAPLFPAGTPPGEKRGGLD